MEKNEITKNWKELGYSSLLVYIQQKLIAPKLRENKFGGYNYRSCEDILQAVKPLLGQSASLVLQDELLFSNNRFYIKATAVLTDEIENKNWQTCGLAREADARKGMSEDQLSGAASSYARKYALNAMFLTDDNTDADGKKQKTSPEIKEITETEQKAIDDIYNKIVDTANEQGLMPDKKSIAAYSYRKTKLYPETPEQVDKFVKHLTSDKKNLQQVCKPMPVK
jgi:hypothetical protein